MCVCVLRGEGQARARLKTRIFIGLLKRVCVEVIKYVRIGIFEIICLEFRKVQFVYGKSKVEVI